MQVDLTKCWQKAVRIIGRYKISSVLHFNRVVRYLLHRYNPAPNTAELVIELNGSVLGYHGHGVRHRAQDPHSDGTAILVGP